MNPLGVAISLFGVGLMLYSKKNQIADAATVVSDSFTAYDSLFKAAGKSWDVPWRWLKTIAWIESDLGRDASVQAGILDPNSPDSVSADGLSYGLMQLTLPTANRPRVRPGSTKRDLNTPALAVDIAARYVHELSLHYFPGDQLAQKENIIRAYNGGPGWKNSSAQALENTSDYFDHFVNKLNLVLLSQPGDELERG